MQIEIGLGNQVRIKMGARFDGATNRHGCHMNPGALHFLGQGIGQTANTGFADGQRRSIHGGIQGKATAGEKNRALTLGTHRLLSEQWGPP